MILQQSLGDTSFYIEFHIPTISTLGILKTNLSLGFFLDHCGGLGTGLHQLCLGRKAAGKREILKSRTNQHQAISSMSGASTVVDSELLMAPYGVALPIHGR